MDIERIQKQVADLKTNVSLLEQSYANDFNADLIRSLHEITDVLDSLQPRVIDPADLSKEAEQKVLNTLSELTARLDRLESSQWSDDDIHEMAKSAISEINFGAEINSADIDVYIR
jgi:hypothetical protein